MQVMFFKRKGAGEALVWARNVAASVDCPRSGTAETSLSIVGSLMNIVTDPLNVARARM
jgi:hypothetical protein